MKKFLSIILAAMLVIGMLPTAFAAVDQTTGAITYEFVVDGVRSTESTYIEDINGNWDATYASYPANPVDAGANWAYRGTTISTPANATKGFSVVSGSYIQTGVAAKGEWIALQINVPKSGSYTVSATGYKKKTFSKGADLYIAPMTTELEAKLTEGNTTTYGTVAAAARTGAESFEYLAIPETAKVGNVSFYKSGSTASEMDLITGVEMNLTAGENIVFFKATADTAAGMFPTSLTLTPNVVTVEPTITVSPDAAEISVGETVALTSVVKDSTEAVAENAVVTYTSNSDCVAVVGSVVTGLAEGTATITASATVDEKTVTDTVTIKVNAKKYTYVFDTSATNEGTAVDLLNDGVFTINPQVSKTWGYVGHRRLDYINLGAAYLAIRSTSSYKELGTNGIVLTITVPENGTYIPTLSYTEMAYGGKISAYIVDPDAVDPATGKKWDMSDDGIFDSIGSVVDNAETASGVKTIASAVNTSNAATTDSPYVGGQVGLRNKTYYLVIAMDGTEATFNSSKKYFSYIDSLELKKAGDLVVEPEITVSANPTSIMKGANTTLTSVVTDSKGDVVAPSVTYTSDSGCVSISGNVVTGVSGGTATITASATVDGKTVTDTIDIVVSINVFSYIFSHDAMKDSFWTDNSFTKGEAFRIFYDTANSTYDANYLDSIDDVNTAKSQPWAVSRLGGTINATGLKYVSSLTENYLQMVGKRTLTHNNTYGDGRFVLELSIPSQGSYDITADIEGVSTGSEADVYIIPTSGFVGEITQDTLKDYPIVGRVSGVAGKVDGDIGNYTFNSAGNYYFVFSFNTENTETGNGARQFLNLKSITLTDAAPKSETPDSVTASAPSFSATTNIPSLASVTVNGTEGNNQVLKPTRGSTVTLSAPEVEGYNFVGWMRGAYNDNGAASKFVDLTKNEDGTYSYKVWSSIYLTAVYEPKEEGKDGKVVRFWNNDGSFLGEELASKLTNEALPTASLIGYAFREWWVAEETALDVTALTSAVTNAVAQYDAKQTVSLAGGEEITLNGATQNSAKYFGTRVFCEDSGATHWLRDGKVVAYGSEYSYYIWDATHIHSSLVAVTPKPLVVLENTTVDGAYMIEYEAPAGYEIAEVGILFAASGTPDVNSASERFSSQRGTSRGQFAAAPSDESYTVARGYMIYTDAAGNAYVIYSK